MPETEAKNLMQRKAKTFFLASRLLPARVRGDVEILYRYFRYVDDMVDEPGSDDVRADLVEVETDLYVQHPRVPVVCAVREVMDRYSIPASLMAEVVHGARADIDHTTPRTFDELYAYADLVAGSVGATMCYVLGDVRAESLLAARYLGIAMQLTNILRDIGEDLHRNRVYIPLEDLRRFEYSQSDLAGSVIDDRFRGLMQLEIYRANQFYCAGVAGIHFLQPRTRPAIQLAATLYRRILYKIEKSGFDVFQRRAAVSGYEKLLSLPSLVIPGRHRVPVPKTAMNGPVERVTRGSINPPDDLDHPMRVPAQVAFSTAPGG